MANILNITAANNGGVYPLRGDMSPVLNFVPDSHFEVTFVTDDTAQFVISSNTDPIKRLDGNKGATFSIGGARNLFVTFMYDTANLCWVPVKTNLAGAGGAGGGGTGPAGEAATVTIGTVTSGPTAQVTNVGTPNDAILNIVLPKGDTGPQGPAGTGGAASLPPGGAIGEVLTKSGTADGAATWAPPAGGTGGGSGGTSSPEVNTQLDSNKNLVLTKAAGNKFRILMTENIANFVNPTGYVAGDIIYVVFEQDTTGGRTIGKYGTAFAFADSQPIAPALGAKALTFLVMYLSGGGEWICRSWPDKAVTAGFGLIKPLARIGTNEFYSMADGFTSLQDGQTLYVTRNGKGSESTATLAKPGTFIIQGIPLADGSLPQLLTYPDTRLSFQKAIINAENGNGQINLTIRDLRVSGARNVDATSRGIAPNGGANITLQNVFIENCENGMLWTGDSIVDITDSMFDGNGQAGKAEGVGYTHNIYAGESLTPWRATRSTFKNSAHAHNIKNRGYVVLRQVYTENALEGREMDSPNGGGVDAENCWFNKTNPNSAQNDLIGIGQEGVITTRTRSYVYKNCRFTNAIPYGRDCTFINNRDTQEVVLIDPLFEGGALENNSTVDGFTTVQGLRGNVRVVLTGGPLGPLLTPGRPTNVAPTPIA